MKLYLGMSQQPACAIWSHGHGASTDQGVSRYSEQLKEIVTQNSLGLYW